MGKEAEKLGIREFEESNRKLAVTMFSQVTAEDEQPNEQVGGQLSKQVDDQSNRQTDKQMLSFILSSGAFGTYANRVVNRIN